MLEILLELERRRELICFSIYCVLGFMLILYIVLVDIFINL